VRGPHRVAVAISLIGIAFGSVVIGDGGTIGRTPIVVVIDAGHGGKEPGAAGQSGVLEKDIMLAVARRIALEAVRYPNLCIVLTRMDDRFLKLTERIARAREARAAVYVSLHANAAADGTARGVETYVADKAHDEEGSRRLAEALQEAVVIATGSRDRGVRSASLYIARASMPAALVEVGFVTEKNEARSLQDPNVQQRIAIAVLETISGFVHNR
jgi:N-acetylmuramoyl-L-alanine amidase